MSAMFTFSTGGVVAEKNFGLPDVGGYVFVAFIATAASSVTAANPPTVTWSDTTLTLLGSVTLNGSDTLLFGGSTDDGLVGFQCAPGTAFAGSVCAWSVESATGITGPLQTATGTSSDATIELSGGANYTWFIMAAALSESQTIVDSEPTVTIDNDGTPPVVRRFPLGATGAVGVTVAIVTCKTVATVVTVDWPLSSAQPWAIMAQPIGIS
jgi:hypothetical protein